MSVQYELTHAKLIRIAATILAACLSLSQIVHAQSSATRSMFELVDGDRVVLLGSGFIEAAQEYGYIELALSTRWPDRNVIFRNVGWSGDTVFGDARSHFTNPPGPYERLLDEACAPRPTVIFAGYGSNVPFEEGDALGRFEEGLLRLLGDLEHETGARLILLSPPPHEADRSPAPMDLVRQANGALKEVSGVIKRVAREHGHLFVDVFAGLDQVARDVDTPITSDGVQLNAAGYYFLARVIEEGLGLPPRGWSLSVNVGSGGVESEGARISEVDVDEQNATLTVEPEFVSVPKPAMLPPEAVPPFHARRLRVTGLRDGAYALTSGGQEIAAAPARTWAQGIALTHASMDARSERLRRLIVEKNRLYFHQYRPPNETYLVGFRSHEQGQNAEELSQFVPLIDEKELEIGRLKRPAALMLKLGPTANP